MLKPRNRQQAGDTIVEVLICIAVIASAMVGAFLVSQRSTETVQDSSEHAAATQLLQAQTENLRADIISSTTAPALGSSFCYNNSGTRTNISGSTNPCTITSGGANYQPNITAQANNTYDLVITWASVLGSQAKVEYFYQVFPSGS